MNTATAETPALWAIRSDPTQVMALASMRPDPWQRRLLSSTCSRTLLLCSRQSGKSTASAALALRQALLWRDSLVLLLSPSLRQSGELYRKVADLYRRLGRPVATAQESALRLELANGSRVISLPGTEDTVRGYSGAALLIIDEASRVPDPLYFAMRPVLAVSGGRLVALSTPFGRRGWFYSEWEGGGGWDRVCITARQCPRISQAFLAEEERALGPRWFAQEYFCSFEDAVDAVFSAADVKAALNDDIEPLFAGARS
jgi:hypothetical protein